MSSSSSTCDCKSPTTTHVCTNNNFSSFWSIFNFHFQKRVQYFGHYLQSLGLGSIRACRSLSFRGFTSYKNSYGWLSIFLLPGTADAEKIMVPPYDEKEIEGPERWLWQVQKCSTNSCSLCKNLAKHTSAIILRLRHRLRNYWSYLSSS